MSDNGAGFFGSLKRSLAGELTRSRETLVPPAFQVLFETARYIVLYGGRGAAKSWSIARVLLTMAFEVPLRILCCREIQGSIRESSFRLLADQIQLLELDDFYAIGADRISGKNGSEFYFEGLRYNASKIRSYEGITTVWIEEAQTVSEFSWETVIPTIRARGSRFFISFNPMTADDPVSRRFVESQRDDVIAHKVSWRDNPYLAPEAHAEREWLERTDPDAYRHVWEGFPRTVSDALILRGKYFAEQFDVRPEWAGPYIGLDYGFARDPSAAVRAYIDDSTRTLYVDAEYWALGAEIDALPGSLEAAIPGIGRQVVYADSARPESTNYIARNGIPGIQSAEKWPGSVGDGIAYLRAFERIVINPACRHLLDECARYSFKQDRLTGAPLPEPLDANNHLIDALRYALSPLIRNQPTGGYFSRAALLIDGEPLEAAQPAARVFVTAALCARPGSAVGLVFWAHWPHRDGQAWPLQVLDYAIAEVSEVLTFESVRDIFARAQELRGECQAPDARTWLWVEEGELREAFGALAEQLGSPVFDVRAIGADQIPPTLDERASAARLLVNRGQHVKLTRHAYTEQVLHRNVTANQLLTQVLGYRPGAPDVSGELTAAFVTGCLITEEP